MTFDDQKPSLSITEPAQDMKTSEADLVLKGTTLDLTAVTITVEMDGKTYSPTLMAGAFEQSLTFTAEKTYLINVRAVDEVGNETVSQRNIVYGVTPPSVTLDPVTSPTNVDSQTLSGTMEAETKVNITSPTASVGAVSYPTATTWETTLTNMKEGDNRITLFAADGGGNVSAPMSASITVDLTPPAVTALSPSSEEVYGGTVGMSATATDTVSGVDRVEYRLDSGEWSVMSLADPSTGTYTATWNPEAADGGTHSLSFRGKDKAGNTGASLTVTFTVQMDTAPPVLSLSTLSNGSWTNNPVLNVAGTATDNTGIRQVTVNENVLSTNPDGTFIYITTLREGPNAITVTATDLAGNHTSDTRTIRLDTACPTSAVTKPLNGSSLIAPTILIAGTASDAGAGVLKVEISTDGGATWGAASGTAGWSYAWTVPADGVYIIMSRATDAAGNVEVPGPGVSVIIYKRQPSAVTISSRQLLVNGSAFAMKGVIYSPVPVGGDPETTAPYGDYFTSDYNTIYDRDFPLLRQMGANTLRLRTWENVADHHDFLDSAYNGGVHPIYIIAGYPIKAGLDIDPQSPNNIRGQLKEDFREMVATQKNHPAILMWGIGNDLNADSMYGRNPANLFSLINEMAAEAHAEEGSSYHPVITALTDKNLISTISTYDATLPSLDIWGANVYRGNTFGTLFNDFEAGSSKPLAILEYGIDAFDNTKGDEYENIGTPYQATYAEALWNEIKANSNVCIGGLIREYSDEWWMGKHSIDTGCPDNNPALHSTCGYSTNSSPDGYANEEWWGIMRSRPNASGPDTMETRVLYYALQELWVSSANASHISVSPNGATFGSTAAGAASQAQVFTISNAGTENLNIGTITLTGTNASEFIKQNDNCSGHTLIPSKTCALQTVLSPVTAGPKSAALSILSDDPNTPTITVGLNGTSTVSISGSVTSGQGPMSGVTITLSGTASATTATDAAGNYTFSGLSKGNYTVTPSKTGYTFTPTSTSVNVSGSNVTNRNFTGTPISFIITPTTGSGGSINPSTPQTVSYNGNVSFTITPGTGYRIVDVSVDGVSRGAISTYSFTNVTANHTISASFASVTFNFAVFGASSVKMSGGGYVDSYDSSKGPYGGAHGPNGPVGTNSKTNAAISLSGGAKIYGDAQGGPAGDPNKVITISGGSVVYGTKSALSAAKDMIQMTDPGGGTSTTFTNGTTLTSGTYRAGSVNLSGNGTGTISGKVTLYVSGNMAVSGNSRIVILPGGSLTVYVSGSISISGGGIVNQTLDPHALMMYGTATCTAVSYSGNSDLYGAIYTPKANTTISGNSSIYGSIIGASVTLSGGGAVHYDESLQTSGD